jgi:hypothetical protein
MLAASNAGGTTLKGGREVGRPRGDETAPRPEWSTTVSRSILEAQWHPSSALRTEPDGPCYASVSTASEVRPSGRVLEVEVAETLAGRDHVLSGLIAQAGPMRFGA